MKNVIKISVIALSAAALMVSCTRETAFEPAPANKTVHTFTCTFAQPDTKVAIANDGKTQWEVGDQILIHAGTDGNDREVVTLTADDISADGKKATITTTLDPYIHYVWGTTDRDDVSEYYAMYPADAAAPGIMYYNAPFGKPNEVLMAACNLEDKFVFFNLSGVITFEVRGDFDNYVFVGNGKEDVSYEVYQARVRDEGSGPKVTHKKGADSYKPLVPLKEAKGTVVAGVNRLGIPGGANFTSGFTFKFYKGEELVKIAKTETAVDLAVGKLLVLGDITDKLEDYVPPTVSDHEVAAEYAEALDLSTANGPANCYIVSAAGYYKLPAVMGNDKEQSVGNVFDVQLVWETYNNGTTVTANSVVAGVDFDAASNYIYFKTPETLKPGNALIAATNSEDKIIWSWHIWIPGSTIQTDTYGIYDKALMDRNLGALVATETGAVAAVESFGLLYQWGRKDPFFGAKRVDSSSYALCAGTPLSSTAGDGSDDSSKITLAQSIANPTLLGHKQGKDWLTPSDQKLWKDAEKTIYDPCPPGYRVPARVKAQPLHSSDLSAQTGWGEDADNKYFTLGSPAAVFPFTGYGDTWSADLSGVSSTGKRTVIWTAYSSSDEIAYCVSVRTAAAGDRHKLEEVGKCNMSSVRCCVE